ncbi:winged helix-turn-helix transcriptional regulator [Streptomyces seoulensis]|uniref:winged helix-turn-helix transcriptional regulator n=1 Tax=Streptomyces seoulensis TaxID=73044 RepID=UPI001FCC73F5|nr:winged helix-turn-helix transcriptional regulator [Streptomyces seoulensis]BDH05854.1 hypothetical protein HEK131_30810 [Streptomyces seoulensis]
MALGDQWSLIALRDVMSGGRRHFPELLSHSEEGIVSNILSSRLKALVVGSLLTQEQADEGGERPILTQAGTPTVPIMVALGSWGCGTARLATFMLRHQGMAGPARWSADACGVRINDGRYSFRDPENRDALPDRRLAQPSAALDLAHPGFLGEVCPTEGCPDGCRAEPRSTTACPRRAEYTRWLATLMPESVCSSV